jgi:thiol-disulfide isomerase/thioredoxin
VVLYTSPTCGPCRTLKPIFSKVVDDYPGKVSNVSDVHALGIVRFIASAEDL